MIKKLFYNNNYITYQELKQNSNNQVGIIYAHGLKSDMNGKKSLALEKFCQKENINFIKFDFYGHGQSSGNFLDGNITKWYHNLKMLITELCTTKQILIGSSMGAWITTLLALREPELVHSMIAIAPAANFTEEIIWKKLTPTQKADFKTIQKFYLYKNSPESIEINYDLILDGRKNDVFKTNRSKIKKSQMPITLLHGFDDKEVPFYQSIKLAKKLALPNINVKLISGADHRLSREEDLTQIINEIKIHLQHK